jgi:hypothetical protein
MMYAHVRHDIPFGNPSPWSNVMTSSLGGSFFFARYGGASRIIMRRYALRAYTDTCRKYSREQDRKQTLDVRKSCIL